MTFDLHLGDCLAVMATMPAASIDTIITDPPYGLAFMGKEWDHGVPGVPFWAEALRVAKPGAMLLAFGGTRTFHRLICAIEDAGWEIRDCIMWLYGSGFPKSHNVSLAIDKQSGATGHRGKAFRTAGAGDRTDIQGKNGVAGMAYTAPATPEAEQWDGWGTALKPAYEPVIVAMKPIDGTFAHNALTHGVAGLWIDGARVPAKSKAWGSGNRDSWRESEGREDRQRHRYGEQDANPGSRWPANVIHDGSDEVTAGFPVSKSTGGQSSLGAFRNGDVYGKGRDERWKSDPGYGDTGSAARFFYCAKASRSERTHGGRIDNRHPTVKPLELMRYLCRLTKTPTGGVVLDPFMGSGSTGVATIMEGREFVGIEQDEASYQTARERIGLTVADMAVM